MSKAGTESTLERGRASFTQQGWEAAFEHLSAADRESALDAEDLERLATCAQLLGKDTSCAELWVRAHHQFLSRDEMARAARCALRLAVPLLLNGEQAQGGGWIARARRLLDDARAGAGLDRVERGYLSAAEGVQAVMAGQIEEARSRFAEAAALGERFRDPDLTALARQGHGRALIYMGEIARGTAFLDEAMAAVTAGELSPSVVGDIYCSVIGACQEMYDLRRANEWTDAFTRWCARQPEMAPYRGQCLLHRAEILQLHGAWPNAREEAERARERLSGPPPSRSVGAASYQIAELHRLRGESDEADAAYRLANQSGRDPQPGLALLRLAQGRVDAAWSAISRSMEETHAGRTRARLLPAFVEIAIAADQIPAARAASDELAWIAADLGAPYLTALSHRARAAVLLAEREPHDALASAREAMKIWADLDAPYFVARDRVLIGLACRALCDNDSSTLELEAAREVFERLGARPDVARVTALLDRSPVTASAGLTAREVEVVRHVATGKTNRAIADALGISEKTVARHVSNIFAKCDLSSRAAVTAYAYEHGLLRPS
ncbi:MAG: response regulator transcription factor [Gemmatimonadota bacterium]|nr:response regulator transcription factor [Gemmatimonadota bacterium]